MHPRHPDIHVTVHSENPLVWISEVRQAMRRAGVERAEIQSFSASALSTPDNADTVRSICSSWAVVHRSA
ncbi:MAG: hypothetical protein AAGD38_12315 [Acidobacteriota bacterium]